MYSPTTGEAGQCPCGQDADLDEAYESVRPTPQAAPNPAPAVPTPNRLEPKLSAADEFQPSSHDCIWLSIYIPFVHIRLVSK